jgi:paired small multidrug resistance pump
MTLDAPTLAGLLGVIVVLAAYFANQERGLRSDDWRFPLANLVGSCLILLSLWARWNWPAAAIEISWIAISLMGLVRSVRARTAA